MFLLFSRLTAIAIAIFPAGFASITFGSITFPSSAKADEHWQCADARVSVSAPSQERAANICDQSEKARSFLAACGIEGTAPLSVRVTRDLEFGTDWRKGGEFDPITRRVRLLPFIAYMRVSKQNAAAAPAVARVMHASIAAHEIAHGIFHERAALLDLPDTAHEYVAYVVQLSTLPADLQKSLMEQADLPVVTNLFTFSFFLLRADPERFALNAYRHFHQSENGCGFLNRVLDSKAHFPPPSD